jgi:hypothetical protein
MSDYVVGGSGLEELAFHLGWTEVNNEEVNATTARPAKKGRPPTRWSGAEILQHARQ